LKHSYYFLIWLIFIGCSNIVELSKNPIKILECNDNDYSLRKLKINDNVNQTVWKNVKSSNSNWIELKSGGSYHIDTSMKIIGFGIDTLLLPQMVNWTMDTIDAKLNEKGKTDTLFETFMVRKYRNGKVCVNFINGKITKIRLESD